MSTIAAPTTTTASQAHTYINPTMARILAAMENLAALEGTAGVPEGYCRNTFAQRLPGGAGSTFTGVKSVEDILAALNRAEDWEEYSHPAIMPGCTAFITRSLGGVLGVVDLAALPVDTVVTLDDRKGTGKVSCVVSAAAVPQRPVAGFTIVILGEEQGREVLFTLHPGEPVRPSSVQTEPGMHGTTVTVAEAINMGLTTAKVA